MRCIVTAGPTYEPLDEVRRLTNFSTGRLGSELANCLADRGHEVTLLLAQQATWQGEHRVARIERFTTTANLSEHLHAFADQSAQAVFHAAAVSDYAFGKVWLRSEQGQLTQIQAGKISTRQGTLLAELLPTPKILQELRAWFPLAKLIGWKYEVDGDRARVMGRARKQIDECLTDACVVNGPAYGAGFGLICSGTECVDLPDDRALFAALADFLGQSGTA